MTIKLIGHRGNGRTTETPFAQGKAPQQTLRSFEQALRNGADGVEFDVFLTRDQVPVIVDQDVFMGHRISQTDSQDVGNICVAGNDKVPTLEQALILLTELNDGRKAADKLFINIELKGPHVAAAAHKVVTGVAAHYGLDKDMIYYSAVERDQLSRIRALDKEAHLQPTILTTELFDPALIQQPGYHVSLKAEYNRAALGNLSKFIRDKGCVAIDTPTGDIRPALIDLADQLNVGFCTHPTGPRRLSEAETIFKTMGLLSRFAAATGNKVVMKVDDVAAASQVTSASARGLKAPVAAMERMMGMPFLII